mgnify:CR=1 FL=1
MNAMKQLKLAKNGYIIMSVLFMILGICLIIWPDCSMAVFCTAVGIMFIVYGAIKIIGYFSRDFYCLAFQFDLGFGILMIAVGILILVRREAILRLIFVIFGLVILTDALLRIQMSVEAKKFGLKLWWAVLLIAVATGIFGMLLLVDPAGGAKLTVIFTGVAFLLEGILKLCVVVYTVKIRENENVVWEDEFREI